jgi:hypothetical protein
MVWSVLIDGVWGPLAQHNAAHNGGPECASQSTIEFKFLTNLALVSAPIFKNNLVVAIPFAHVGVGQPSSPKGVSCSLKRFESKGPNLANNL